MISRPVRGGLKTSQVKRLHGGVHYTYAKAKVQVRETPLTEELGGDEKEGFVALLRVVRSHRLGS
jgi:hypothetical protein